MHEFALEWVLRSLEAGQPYPAEEWPKALAPVTAVPKHLEPVTLRHGAPPRPLSHSLATRKTNGHVRQTSGT